MWYYWNKVMTLCRLSYNQTKKYHYSGSKNICKVGTTFTVFSFDVVWIIIFSMIYFTYFALIIRFIFFEGTLRLINMPINNQIIIVLYILQWTHKKGFKSLGRKFVPDSQLRTVPLDKDRSWAIIYFSLKLSYPKFC